ncbi:hypothetical protein OHA59_43485 [Streptomyces sp. NBC_01589]|uniref:hypothetical protein n=1 Tax=Streptomyces sp. NBC_01589 TaxID=2975886 RepID=UPI003866EB34
MEIVVLAVPDCPNETLAADRLRQALDEEGRREVGFTVRVIAEQAEAERIGFTGSPTIWIGGRDPFAEAGRAPGLACRVYRTPDALAGAPELGELRQALRAGASRG